MKYCWKFFLISYSFLLFFYLFLENISVAKSPYRYALFTFWVNVHLAHFACSHIWSMRNKFTFFVHILSQRTFKSLCFFTYCVNALCLFTYCVNASFTCFVTYWINLGSTLYGHSTPKDHCFVEWLKWLFYNMF